MQRRKFLSGSLACLSGLTNTQAFGKAFSIKRRARPNILLIVSDQERSRADLPTNLPLPAHDQLLQYGTSFDNYYVTTAPCGPSRSVIYTGQHVQHTSVFANPGATQQEVGLSPHIETLGAMMRKLGYYTAYKGKWHLTHHALGQSPNLDAHGFSDYRDENFSDGGGLGGFEIDPRIARDASHWLQNIQQRVEEQPWFLAVNFINPHDIMYFDATGKQESSRIRPGFVSKLATAPDASPYTHFWDQELPRSFYEDDPTTKPHTHKDHSRFLDYLLGESQSYDEETWRRWQSYYFNCIQDVDTHLETVLNALQASGQFENTIIIYSSDHGERAGAHGLRLKGPDIYKENLRVPLIIRHPDIAGGASTPSLASSVDLVPTILNLANEANYDLKDLFPFLSGVNLSGGLGQANKKSERDSRGTLFSYSTTHAWDPDHFKRVILGEVKKGERPSLNNISLLRGIFDGRYKFARYFRPSQHHQPKDWATLTKYNELELYDTLNDPDEITNLAYKPEEHKNLILALNDKLNDLINLEIGKGQDNGSEYPGPTELYQL